jgi:hypothetical protein
MKRPYTSNVISQRFFCVLVLIIFSTNYSYGQTVTITSPADGTAYVVGNTVPVPTSTFTATSPVNVGSNATITYTGTDPSSSTFTWNFDSGVINSGSGIGLYSVTWSSPGIHNVTLTVTNAPNPSYSIKITNSTGKILKTIYTTQDTWQDNINYLLPGAYIVDVVNNSDNTKVGQGKFVKL